MANTNKSPTPLMDFNKESEEDEGSYQENASGVAENRWQQVMMEQMDTVNTFLDNEEDSLPELFDPTTVVKQKSDICHLCNTSFSGKMSSILVSKDKKKHNCKRCGVSVCTLCSSSPKRRLSKIDKKKYRVCDECDTLMSNVNFDQMYQTCLQQQEETLTEVKHNIAKRDI